MSYESEKRERKEIEMDWDDVRIVFVGESTLLAQNIAALSHKMSMSKDELGGVVASLMERKSLFEI